MSNRAVEKVGHVKTGKIIWSLAYTLALKGGDADLFANVDGTAAYTYVENVFRFAATWNQ